MTLNVPAAIAWALANKQQVLADAAMVVAGASLLVKGLEALAALLATVFPGLKSVDGELQSVAAFLDRLSKAKLLNVVALSPKAPVAPVEAPKASGAGVSGAAVVLAVAGLLGFPGVTHAQPIVSSGPTLPLMEVRPGDKHPVSLAPGAGYQLSVTLPQLQRAIAGRAWDLADLNLMAFGSAISSSSGQTFGALSAAAGVCTLSSLICGGVGHDLVTAQGTLGKWFFVFALSINIDLAPSAPPTGYAFDHATWGMLRGNTLYLGAP